MKILILKNKISTSLKPKLDNVKTWFSSVLDLEFTEETTNFKIVNGNYSYYDTNNKLQTYKAVDETWYDENISKPAKKKGYDIVALMIKSGNWLSKIVEGFGTSIPDWGIEEIAIKYYTSGTYNFNGVALKGDKFEWILIHELLHRIYNIKGLQDNTHKYFLLGTPEKCLEDFKIIPTIKYKYFNEIDDPKMIGVNPKLMAILDTIRGECGFPITITSGFRTKIENDKLKGSVKDSEHLLGLAVDVNINTSNKVYKFIKSAINNGITRIGVGNGFCHIGIDTSKPQEVIWGYLE